MSEQRHAQLAIHAEGQSGGHHPVKRVAALRKMRMAGILLVLLLLAGAAVTLALRASRAAALGEQSRGQMRRHVQTVHPQAAGAGGNVALPGTLQGQIEAPISARVGGYLLRWTHDIGSRVKKGEVLAEISNPETDQQLAQAVAARVQLVSTVELAQATLSRWQNLRRSNAVSQQEFDERSSAYAQARANLAAADANIRRLRELQSFQKVVAPFAGIITRRNTNVGDLVDAAGGVAGKPLFVLAQNDPLRLYVYVPQAYAAAVKVGQEVSVTQAELPGRRFTGRVARTAGAIDSASRSLQTEISLPNPDGALLPGAYVEAALKLGADGVLTVPTNALHLRAEGPRVAVVDDKGRVNLRAVTLGKDFGLRIEVASGLSARDDVIVNPSDSIEDGDQVEVAQPRQERNAQEERKAQAGPAKAGPT
ncbi:efflux RND transporter periplasmic adaptor subunit [Noviherbaspirillum pedocola]|uniref:Efflux RND transporter periplasmic adaptor subunit n=1 Tax=Noviherbaspirillum pedocola TaxID=2801341 RepID=A0A934W3F9_9BURK|nr:efflux RND transporter periplasmic adaptor subunit [Noviherbaspirillum pedocola]MBK4737396.1 efflux RND transporter periplasmic adaptor subunit [Noviherbaspirillum pedocola]